MQFLIINFFLLWEGNKYFNHLLIKNNKFLQLKLQNYKKGRFFDLNAFVIFYKLFSKNEGIEQLFFFEASIFCVLVHIGSGRKHSPGFLKQLVNLNDRRLTIAQQCDTYKNKIILSVKLLPLGLHYI